VIDLQHECATMGTCDFLDVKPGEWSLGLKNPNLVQIPFLFSQPNVIEK